MRKRNERSDTRSVMVQSMRKRDEKPCHQHEARTRKHTRYPGGERTTAADRIERMMMMMMLLLLSVSLHLLCSFSPLVSSSVWVILVWPALVEIASSLLPLNAHLLPTITATTATTPMMVVTPLLLLLLPHPPLSSPHLFFLPLLVC